MALGFPNHPRAARLLKYLAIVGPAHWRPTSRPTSTPRSAASAPAAVPPEASAPAIAPASAVASARRRAIAPELRRVLKRGEVLALIQRRRMECEGAGQSHAQRIPLKMRQPWSATCESTRRGEAPTFGEGSSGLATAPWRGSGPRGRSRVPPLQEGTSPFRIQRLCRSARQRRHPWRAHLVRPAGKDAVPSCLTRTFAEAPFGSSRRHRVFPGGLTLRGPR